MNRSPTDLGLVDDTAFGPVDHDFDACHCTMVEQDESCPIGYPSLLCEDCDGTGTYSGKGWLRRSSPPPTA